jgi:hypothetical protein
MDKLVKSLKFCFFVQIAAALVLVVMYETELIPPGALNLSNEMWFIILTVMELVTIVVIPAALYLFKMKRVKAALKATPIPAMKRYGLMRLLMLGFPLVANTDLYYMSMNPTFGYMAIILLLVLPFVYPSKARCEEELKN